MTDLEEAIQWLEHELAKSDVRPSMGRRALALLDAVKGKGEEDAP